VDAAKRDELFERARGAFLGLAIGDALGATTEFMNPAEIKAAHGVHRKMIGGGWLHLRPGQVTDDTEMSLAIADAVIAHGGWNLVAIADAFVAWMRGKPIDIGATVRKGVRNWMLKGQIETPQNDWDAGNGAAMRMTPVALFTFGDDALLCRCTLEQAHITHNHPLSDAACICLGRMVHAALDGADRVALHVLTRDLVEQHDNFRFNNYRGEASGYVVDTLRTVFHYFFATADFEECLIGVVNQGGDADTTGAIAGMIAGAHYGPAAIPAAWLKKLDSNVQRQVEEAAANLLNLSPLLAREKE